VGTHQAERVQYKVKHKNKLKQFVYKVHMMGEQYQIGCEAVGGHFGRAQLIWTCLGPDGSKVFEVHGDGRNARLQTFGTQNVIACILLGFAVGCKFDPEEVQQVRRCGRSHASFLPALCWPRARRDTKCANSSRSLDPAHTESTHKQT